MYTYMFIVISHHSYIHGDNVLTYICVCNVILFQRNISSESVDKLEPVGVRSLFYLLWKFLWFSFCVWCFSQASLLWITHLIQVVFSLLDGLSDKKPLTVLWAMPPKAEKQHCCYLIASVWTAAERAEHQVQLAHEGGGCRDWDTFQTSANECKHCCNKDNTAWGNVSSPQKVIESIFSQMRLTCNHALIALVLWKSGKRMFGWERTWRDYCDAKWDFSFPSCSRVTTDFSANTAWTSTCVGTYVCLFSAWPHEVACWLMTPETGRRKQMKGGRRDCSCASNYKRAQNFTHIPPMSKKKETILQLRCFC